MPYQLTETQVLEIRRVWQKICRQASPVEMQTLYFPFCEYRSKLVKCTPQNVHLILTLQTWNNVNLIPEGRKDWYMPKKTFVSSRFSGWENSKRK